MTKRVLSLLLTLAMVLSLCVPALAADDAFEGEAPAEVVEEQAPAAPVEPEAPEAEEPVYEEPVVDEPAIEEPVEVPEVAAVAVDEPATVAIDNFDPNGKETRDFIKVYDEIKGYVELIEAGEWYVATNTNEDKQFAEAVRKSDAYAKLIFEGIDEGEDCSNEELARMTTRLQGFLPTTNNGYAYGHLTNRPTWTISNNLSTATLADLLSSNGTSSGSKYSVLTQNGQQSGTGKSLADVKALLKDGTIAKRDGTFGVTYNTSPFNTPAYTFTAPQQRSPFWSDLQAVVADLAAKLERVDINNTKASGYLTYKEANELLETIELWKVGGEMNDAASKANIQEYAELEALKAQIEDLKKAVEADEKNEVYTAASKGIFNDMYTAVFDAGGLYGAVTDANGLKKNCLYVDWYKAWKAMSIMVAEGEKSVLKPNDYTIRPVNGNLCTDNKFKVNVWRDATSDEHTYYYTYKVGDSRVWAKDTSTYELNYDRVTFTGNLGVLDLAPLTADGTAGGKFVKDQHIEVFVWADGTPAKDFEDAEFIDSWGFDIIHDTYSGPMYALDQKGNPRGAWVGHGVTNDPNRVSGCNFKVWVDMSGDNLTDSYEYMQFRLEGPDGVQYVGPKTEIQLGWTGAAEWFASIVNSPLDDVYTPEVEAYTTEEVVEEHPGDWTIVLRVEERYNDTMADHDWVTVKVPDITNYGKPAAGTTATTTTGFPKLQAELAKAITLSNSDVIVTGNMDLATATAKLQKAINDAQAYVAGAAGKAYVTKQVTEVDKLTAALTDAQKLLGAKADMSPLQALVDYAKGLNPDDYDTTKDSWKKDLPTAIAAAEALIAKGVAAGEAKNAVSVTVNGVAYKVDENVYIAKGGYQALQKAISALTKASAIVERRDLVEAIKAAKDMLENDMGLTSNGAASLEKAIAAAEKALNSATVKSEFNAATDTLWGAMDSAERKGDKEALWSTIDVAVAIMDEQDVYTEESWKAADLENALNAAFAVGNDPNATQPVVDEAVKALQKAIDTLVTKEDQAAFDALFEAVEEARAQYAIYPTETLETAILTAANALLQGEGKADFDKAAADLADAVVTAKGEQTKAVEALKTALTDAQTKAEDKAVTEATKAELKAVADKIGAMDAKTTKTEIEAAKTALDAAVAKIEGDIKAAADALQAAKDALGASIKAAETQQAAYTTEALDKAITDAEAALAAEDATVETLTAAKTTLDAAVTAANDAQVKYEGELSAAQTKLAAAVEKVAGEAEKKHTEKFAADLKDALTKAETAKSSTVVADVVAAAEALEALAAEAETDTAAQEAAEALAAAKAELATAVTAAEAEAKKNHTADFLTALNAAIEAAKKAAEATDIADVTKAATDLAAAMTGAAADTEKKDAADAAEKALADAKAALAADVTAAKAEAEKKHTDAFKTELDAAVKAAEAAADATDIADVTKASDGLKAVMAKAADDTKAQEAAEALAAAKTALTKAIADAKAAATKSYTDASKKAYDDALAAAEKALAAEDATVTTLGAAQTALETAVKGLTELPAAPKSGTGWAQTADGTWYYYNANKLVRNAWQWSCGEWYYMGADGLMYTGFKQIDGKWYMFETSNANQRQGMLMGGWVATPYGAGYFVNEHNGRFGECTYTDQLGSFVNGHFEKGDPVAA